MTEFKLYDYLSFILPGALVLGSAIYAFLGWPWDEPGVAGTTGLIAASYVVGHLNSAIAVALQPLAFGRGFGSRPPTTHGLFGERGHFNEDEEAEIRALFDEHFGPELSFETQYDLAYTLIQHHEADQILRSMNEQIGFYRSMASASLIAIILVIAGALFGKNHLDPWLAGTLLAVATGLFVYRFRWFWTRFGHNVVRGGLVLLRARES